MKKQTKDHRDAAVYVYILMVEKSINSEQKRAGISTVKTVGSKQERNRSNHYLTCRMTETGKLSRDRQRS